MFAAGLVVFTIASALCGLSAAAGHLIAARALQGLGGDLMHPGVGLVVLLAITALNIYKPAGVTPYGWRKQREQRLALRRRQTELAVLKAPTEPAASRN